MLGISLIDVHPLIEIKSSFNTLVIQEYSKMAIEAFIMRLMKTLTKMDYKIILEKVQSHFKGISPESVYQAVQSLLSSNHIKTDQGFSNTYIYN